MSIFVNSLLTQKAGNISLIGYYGTSLSLVKVCDDLGMGRGTSIHIFVYVCVHACVMQPAQSQMTNPQYPSRRESTTVIAKE